MELFGSQELFEKFRNEPDDSLFTESEQVTIDAAHRAFIEKYEVLDESMVIYQGPKGDIRNMPLSSLTANEWSRISELMAMKLGSDAFDRLFDPKATTTGREDFALAKALTELFGRVEYQQLWQSNGISSFETQNILDDNSRLFL